MNQLSSNETKRGPTATLATVERNKENAKTHEIYV